MQGYGRSVELGSGGLGLGMVGKGAGEENRENGEQSGGKWDKGKCGD